jgi:hypothetical protein
MHLPGFEYIRPDSLGHLTEGWRQAREACHALASSEHCVAVNGTDRAQTHER